MTSVIASGACGQSNPWDSFNHDRKKKDGHALEMQGVRKAEEGADTVLLGRNQRARLIPGDAPEKFRGVWLLGWRPPTVRWSHRTFESATGYLAEHYSNAPS
jgi:hypothetical protein